MINAKRTLFVAANISYSGSTFNTMLMVEYKHTGKQWFYTPKKGGAEHFTESEEIAQEKKAKGLKVVEKPGHWFIDRLAIPTITANGKNDFWYINNPGDNYKINKCSKYWTKIHEQLSKQQSF